MDLNQETKVLGVQSFVSPPAFLSNLGFKLYVHRAYQREHHIRESNPGPEFISGGSAKVAIAREKKEFDCTVMTVMTVLQ